ncbi:hypothetical protein P7K49_004314, partial [Saguinus oedipus]
MVQFRLLPRCTRLVQASPQGAEVAAKQEEAVARGPGLWLQAGPAPQGRQLHRESRR